MPKSNRLGKLNVSAHACVVMIGFQGVGLDRHDPGHREIDFSPTATTRLVVDNPIAYRPLDA